MTSFSNTGAVTELPIKILIDRYYRASVAWMDSQVGRVLDELQQLGLENDTMVVLHSDHGWSLGEHGEWQKFSNFEHGTRVPLIMRVRHLSFFFVFLIRDLRDSNLFCNLCMGKRFHGSPKVLEHVQMHWQN